MPSIARKIVAAFFACAVAGAPARAQSAGDARQSNTTDVDLDHMVLVVSEAWTAQVFHIVDQLSQWDQYAHKQYVRWARAQLLLSAQDSALLARHAAMRRARGWGHGFEQSFLVDAPIEAAALRATASGLLSAPEANEEKAILLHFASKLEPLRRAERERVDAFRQELLANRARLTPIVDQMARFAGATSVVRVPVFIMSNPEETSGGGEANGGRLVIEVPSPSPIEFVLHESLHVLLAPKANVIKAAANSAGIPFETLNEAVAYALAPGITDDAQQNDYLPISLSPSSCKACRPTIRTCNPIAWPSSSVRHCVPHSRTASRSMRSRRRRSPDGTRFLHDRAHNGKNRFRPRFTELRTQRDQLIAPARTRFASNPKIRDGRHSAQVRVGQGHRGHDALIGRLAPPRFRTPLLAAQRRGVLLPRDQPHVIASLA